MALDSGPESRVRTPGASDKEESSDVANVKVTNRPDPAAGVGGGRCGASTAARSAENVSFSAMLCGNALVGAECDNSCS